MSRLSRVVAVLVVMSLGIAVAACSGTQGTQPQQQQTSEGATSSAPASSTAGLPKDLPVHSGEITHMNTVEAAGTRTVSFTIMTSDSIKSVYTFYTDQLKARGWNIVSATETVASGNISASKASAFVTISIYPSAGKTGVSVSFTSKK